MPEALWVARGLRETRSTAELSDTVRRIRATAQAVSHLTLEQRCAARVPCALLSPDGACTIHAFRPIGCHSWTSFSKAACDRALAEGEPGHAGPMDHAVWETAGCVTDGLQRGVRAGGADAGHYELHSALLLALTVLDAETRWMNHEGIFHNCAVVRSGRLAPSAP